MNLMPDILQRSNCNIAMKKWMGVSVKNHQSLRVIFEELRAKLLVCRDRVKNHRITEVITPQWQHRPAIVVFLGVFFVFLFALTGKEVADALVAAGTLGVVFWAVYDQQIKEYRDRPVLKIMPFELEPPYFREATEYSGSVASGKGYYINLYLLNVGRTIAKGCQPLLNAQWRKQDGKFQKEGNWLPLGLLWALDEPAKMATGRATEEKNLIPNRPYFFDLGCVSNQDDTVFHLRTIVEPSAQKHLINLRPGEYCFEVLVSAEKCKPLTCYFYVEWKGGYPDSEQEAGKHIEITQSTKPPI